MSQSRGGFYSKNNMDRLANEAVNYHTKTGKFALIAPTSRMTPTDLPLSLTSNRTSSVAIKPVSRQHEYTHGLTHFAVDVSSHFLPGSQHYLMPKVIGVSLTLDTYDRVNHALGRGVPAKPSFVCGALGAIAETTVGAVSYGTVWTAAASITLSSGMAGLPFSAGLVTYSMPVIARGSKGAGDFVQYSCQKLLTSSDSPADTRISSQIPMEEKSETLVPVSTKIKSNDVCKGIYVSEDGLYLNPAGEVCARLGVNERDLSIPTVEIGVYDRGIFKVATHGETSINIREVAPEKYISFKTCRIPERVLTECREVPANYSRNTAALFTTKPNPMHLLHEKANGTGQTPPDQSRLSSIERRYR